MNQIGEASGDVMASVANEGGIVKRIYDSYMQFREKMIAWSKIADYGYMQSRLLPFTYGK
jgi:TRAP-type mannitol/chloroaromatic compound transport system substrate-binding protein